MSVANESFEDLMDGLMSIGIVMVEIFIGIIRLIIWLEIKLVEYSGRLLVWSYDILKQYIETNIIINMDDETHGKDSIQDGRRKKRDNTLRIRSSGDKQGED